jgi:hypothetical protein
MALLDPAGPGARFRSSPRQCGHIDAACFSRTNSEPAGAGVHRKSNSRRAAGRSAQLAGEHVGYTDANAFSSDPSKAIASGGAHSA